MKNVIRVVLIVLACFAVGYVIGNVMGANMSKKAEKGFIGPSCPVIDNGVMTPEILLSLGRVSDPQLSPDGRLVLFGVSYNSIEENRSCRNIYVCNADGGGRVQLTKSGKSISNARWADGGDAIVFVKEGQIWKASFKNGKIGRKVKMSDVPSGIGEFKLSPDGTKVLYTSTIKNPLVDRPKDTDAALDKAGAYSTEDLMYRHWDHWVTEIPRTYVASFGTDVVTPENSKDILGDEMFELPTEPFGGIEQLDWAPDSRRIAYSCRKLSGINYAFSTNANIYLYDIETSETSAVTVKGGYDTDPVWSPDGKRLAWISMARDGYEADRQRIMLVDVEGLQASGQRWLAAGLDRDASGLVWSADGKSIYFNALTDGIQAIFKVGVDDDKLQRLTSTELEYDFSSPFAVKDDGTLLASYNCLNFPTELVAVKGDSLCRITTENDAIFDSLKTPSSESVYVKTIDGKDMQCWVMYPPEFDEHKVYPAVEIVLGGPQSTNSQHWNYRWCYRLMAQQGYIVIMPNRRGTTAFGQEWKEQISGDYGGLNMQDYLCAGRWIKSKPYVGKLACVGASYGGFSAYMLEGLHGDLFDCFVSHAGIFDEKNLWYTTEESWFANWDGGGLTEYAFKDGQTGPAGDGVTFGGMQQAGAPYAITPKAVKHYAGDPSSMITKWRTPILCIHGMMDFRIPYTQGMAAFNAAKMMGVPAKLVVFTEENHWILQPQNSVYWHREVFDWLQRWTK